MSFLLCHNCLGWGEPFSGVCPNCFELLDGSVPDPPLFEIQQRLGDFLGRMGEVKITRRRLPKLGMLYATTKGLFFIPHEERTVSRERQRTRDSSLPTMLYAVAATVWTPLMLGMPLVRRHDRGAKQFTVHRPHFLTQDDSTSLAERLMEHPGAFFVERDSVAAFEKHWMCWSIRRRSGSQIFMKPCSQAAILRDRLESYLYCGRFETQLVSVS